MNLAQDIGTFFILALAGLLAWSAKKRREMPLVLMLIAAYLCYAVTVRILVRVGMLSQLDGRVVNGLVAGIFVVAIALAVLPDWWGKKRSAQLTHGR